MQRIMRRRSADEMNGRRLHGSPGASLLGALELREIRADGLDQRIDADPQVRRPIRKKFFQSHAPELERADGNALLELEIARGNLNDRLIKFPILAVIFEPDLFERLVAFEEKPVVELLNALQKARIVLRIHDEELTTKPGPRQSDAGEWKNLTAKSARAQQGSVGASDGRPAEIPPFVFSALFVVNFVD